MLRLAIKLVTNKFLLLDLPKNLKHKEKYHYQYYTFTINPNKIHFPLSPKKTVNETYLRARRRGKEHRRCSDAGGKSGTTAVDWNLSKRYLERDPGVKRKVFKRLWPRVTPTDAHFIRGIVSAGRARHVRKGTDSRKTAGRRIAMEGKRSHDFLGRERLPNSRGHGVTLFQNAAWPSVAAAARILASLHAISSFSSPPLAALTGWGGERGGERSSSLFFLELSVDRPSTTAPRERGRTRKSEYPGRKGLERVFSVRIRKALKR